MQRGKSPIRGPPSRKDSDINESPKINNSNSNNNNNNINIYRVNSSNNNININNIEDNIFRADNYNIIKQIGEGTFGKIYYVEDKNKKKYAMKKILANAQVEIDALEKAPPENMFNKAKRPSLVCSRNCVSIEGLIPGNTT